MPHIKFYVLGLSRDTKHSRKKNKWQPGLGRKKTIMVPLTMGSQLYLFGFSTD